MIARMKFCLTKKGLAPYNLQRFVVMMWSRLPLEDLMPKVTIANDKKEIEVPAGSNLRRALMMADVAVYAGVEKYLNCRGLGMCGTCRILVKQGMENLSKKSILERLNFMLHPKTSFAVIGTEEESRLACQCTVNGDCTIEVTPAFNLSGDNFWNKPYPNK